MGLQYYRPFGRQRGGQPVCRFRMLGDIPIVVLWFVYVVRASYAYFISISLIILRKNPFVVDSRALFAL